ncbi:MAG TPA: SHOCT domain-containing protein [Spirochaetota bacterium]|nr:SHOCT domain-containing protein [Spirochaetota bacterium]
MKTIRKFLLIISGLILVLPAALSAAPGYCNWAYGPGWHRGMFFGGGMFMWIFNILILGVVIFLAVRFFRHGSFSGAGNETALDILKKRLAKGEITKDEYEALKKDII